jgi:hypothetical protein
VSEELKKFRESIDCDIGLQSKRKLLVVACSIFLAINLTGATIEEANTFIFKIRFSNHAGLSILFVASIFFLTIRYYSYAQDYHSKLHEFWSGRLLSDYKIFSFDHHDGTIGGFLGKAINVYGGDEPGIENARYRVSGIFQRSVSYESTGTDEERGKFYYTEYIGLNKFGKNWRLHHYLWLLILESKYQIEALLKYREGLDLLAPYLLSLVAISSYFFKSSVLAII